MIEYALIAGLVSVGALGILSTVGDDVKDVFTKMEGKISDALQD